MNPRLVIAPLSNGRARDWPLGHFRQLAMLFVERLDAIVEFVGMKAQRHIVNGLVRKLPADRYRNHCGLLNWQQTGVLLRNAACTISNNSGIGHYAADLGVPIVCVFGATHSPFEWMPRGPHVSVMIRRTACSICGVDRYPADCPHDLRCLTDITPLQVFDEVRRLGAFSHEHADAAAENPAALYAS